MSDNQPDTKRDINIAQALKGEAASLWADLGLDVRRSIANIVGRQTVTNVGDDGKITVLAPTPDATTERVLSKLAGSPVTVGDDVITLIMPGGHEIVLGAIATGLNTNGVQGVSDSAGINLDLKSGQLTATPIFGSATGQVASGKDLAAEQLSRILGQSNSDALKYCKRLTADFPNSSNGSAQFIGELTTPVLANQVWVVDIYLQVGSDATGGVRIYLGGSPTSYWRAVVKGSQTTPESQTSEVLYSATGGGIFGSKTFASGRTDGWIEVHACISCGATSGNFNLGMLSWASGINAVVYKNSYIEARNIT